MVLRQTLWVCNQVGVLQQELLQTLDREKEMVTGYLAQQNSKMSQKEQQLADAQVMSPSAMSPPTA